MAEKLDSRMNIRPARATDAEMLGRFGTRFTALHHEFDPRRFISPGPRTPRIYGEFLKGQIDRADTILLVAETNNDLAGYVWAGAEGPDYMALRGPAGVIYDLFVDPASRRLGIGRALLREAIRLLNARELQSVVLSTAHRNSAAQQLFASEGFRPTMIEMTLDTRDDDAGA